MSARQDPVRQAPAKPAVIEIMDSEPASSTHSSPATVRHQAFEPAGPSKLHSVEQACGDKAEVSEAAEPRTESHIASQRSPAVFGGHVAHATLTQHSETRKTHKSKDRAPVDEEDTSDAGRELMSDSVTSFKDTRSEEERELHAQKTKTIRDALLVCVVCIHCSRPSHLQALGSDLDKKKDVAKLTKLDELHISNVSSGRDKFKTLKQIRSGNTKSRVLDFEKM